MSTSGNDRVYVSGARRWARRWIERTGHLGALGIVVAEMATGRNPFQARVGGRLRSLAILNESAAIAG